MIKEPNNDLTHPHNWTNIFHLTTSDDHTKKGSRLPVVFYGKNILSIKTTNCNPKFQKCMYPYEGHYPQHVFKTKLKINEKHSFEIQQMTSADASTLWCIKIDNVLKQCNEILEPQDFEKVYLYVSNPWHTSFEDYFELSDLVIEKLM